MRLGFFLLGMGLCLTPVFSFAFINIETLRVNPVDGYSGNLDLSGQTQSGNTEKNLVNFSSLNRYHSGSHEYLLVANYRYGESFKNKDTHRGSFHLRYAHQLREFFWGEFFFQSAFDEFKALNQRDLLGAGGRFQLVKRQDFFMFLGGGFFAEKELISWDPNEENLRGNFYLSSVYDGESPIRVSLVAYFQPLWNEWRDHRFNVDLSLESPIYKKLSLMVSYSYQFDNRPPTNVKKEDGLSLVGIRWSL